MARLGNVPFAEKKEKGGKNKMKGKLKNKRGITLIALVITIIVLIILAGISINLLIGDNGIITRAKDAKVVQEKADLITRIGLDITAKQIQNKGTITQAEVEEILEGYGEVVKSNGQIVSVGPTGKDYVIPFSEIYSGELEVVEEETSTLANITSANYGDYIDLGKNIVGTSATTDDWRILYNDTTNGKIYAILADYMPTDEENHSDIYTMLANLGLTSNSNPSVDMIYSEYLQLNPEDLEAEGAEMVAKLNGTYSNNYWKQLLTGTNNIAISSGISNNKINVKGAVTLETLLASYNEKHGLTGSNAVDCVNEDARLYENLETQEGYDELYICGNVEDCYGYWLATQAEDR